MNPIDRVVNPEIMLPTQFFDALRQQATLQRGECRLIVAVLEDAIRRFQKYATATDRHGQQMFREVEEWIAGRQAGGEPSFGFEYICAVLGLDPDYVREGLQRWQQRLRWRRVREPTRAK